MISVAMTTYNGEKYIIEQLNSIINQSLQPDEVIICDDGSTDKTIPLIENFIQSNNLEKKWKLVKNNYSLGFIKNFIKAINLTRGDIIFLSDQDDVFIQNKFQIMIKYFEQYPECVVLNANYSMIDKESKKIENYRIKSPKRSKKIEKLSFQSYLYNSNYPGFSIAFKKNIKKELESLNLDNVYGHDILINLIGLQQKGCYAIPDILSKYRIHTSNTSGVGEVTNDLLIISRIQQKEKELKEYVQLRSFISSNGLSLDKNIIYKREKILRKRILYLQNKNIIFLLGILLFSRTYPKSTILGDIFYIMKRGRE
ncbi:glycosyltransferase [Beduini massiliensis]|uniref:glycosyltransferase n=1 Tax=Beduini massiliensis TaxID=1585974 RepID=UPI00059AB020|nr:glycosyltransferase [Beduini massiliensis]